MGDMEQTKKRVPRAVSEAARALGRRSTGGKLNSARMSKAQLSARGKTGAAGRWSAHNAAVERALLSRVRGATVLTQCEVRERRPEIADWRAAQRLVASGRLRVCDGSFEDGLVVLAFVK